MYSTVHNTRQTAHSVFEHAQNLRLVCGVSLYDAVDVVVVVTW